MNMFLFVAFPYVALIFAVVGGLYRYYTNRFTYSSYSSQLIESRQLFWGSVPWHYGIILILLAHLFAGLFPKLFAFVVGGNYRLLGAELIGMSLALFTAFGLAILIIRRLPHGSPLRALTSPMDAILLAFLMVQVVSGVGIAMFLRWGSLWYLDTAVPWFWSILSFRPQTGSLPALPAFVQFHMINGFVIILLFPFTRLVHIFTVPLTYLWRPYQVVVWYRGSRRLTAQKETPR